MKRKNQISKMKSDFSFFSKKAITLVTILLPLFAIYLKKITFSLV